MAMLRQLATGMDKWVPCSAQADEVTERRA
jgi:hypothetical protein